MPIAPVYFAMDREVRADVVWWVASNRVQCGVSRIQHMSAAGGGMTDVR
jgi:hypothetical protein